VGQEFETVRGQYSWFPSATLAADFVRKNPPKNASILIKGSRGSKMETLLEALSGDI
jgi:UDP-N-acetylmuramoyl-tripeptide--D-alanyl-D-alanine ligase